VQVCFLKLQQYIDLAHTSVVNEQEMIEAGNRDYFPNVSLRFNITSIPQAGMNGRTQEVVIGAILGGSSAINGMVVYRGTKEDYDAWKTLGGPGSTWDWNGVFPYFKKVSACIKRSNFPQYTELLKVNASANNFLQAFHFNPPNPEVAAQFNITYDPNNWIVQNPNSKLEASYASGFLSGLSKSISIKIHVLHSDPCQSHTTMQ